MTKPSLLTLALALLLSACGGERPVTPPEPLPGRQLVLDEAFGTKGQVRTSLKRYSESYAAALQPDGKIIAVGTTTDAAGDTFFSLVRYLPDGTLDAAFGDGGKVVTSLQPPEISFQLAIPWSVTLQQDGKIVLAGFRNLGNPNVNGPGLAPQLSEPELVSQLVVIRYMPDGELDTSFGVGGFFSLETGRSAAYDVLVQPDGKLVVAGESGDLEPDTVLLRLTPAGNLDRSFGVSGLATLPPGGGKASVVLTNKNQYLLASGKTLFRLNRDGTLDASFRGPKFEGDYGPQSLALQPDGSIVVGTTVEVGYGEGLVSQTSPIPQTEIVVRRFSEDGRVDLGFGRDGAIVIGEGGSRALADLTVQPDGKIVVTGYDALVARLSTDGTLEASAVGAFENAETVLPTQENALIIVGFTRSANGRDFALAKFLPQAAEAE